MRKSFTILLVFAAVGGLATYLVAGEGATEPTAWNMEASIIEACSCPMFCQCYFNPSPAAHGDHGGDSSHFCRFNNAFRLNGGNFGATDLTGAKFWVAGDLGSDFSTGKMDWAVLHFDAAVTPEQREGIGLILGKVYPVEWQSFVIGADAPMEWMADKDHAKATLGGGEMAEVVLHRMPGMSDDPVVIHNLRYWGLPRNEGFVLMPNEVEAYRVGDKAFEFKGTNGFMISFALSSEDVEAASAGT
jgi:hypothetical protein